MVQDFSLPFDDHLDGFAIAAIHKQLNRKVACSFCNRPGACTTCAVPNCQSKKRCGCQAGDWY